MANRGRGLCATCRHFSATAIMLPNHRRRGRRFRGGVAASSAVLADMRVVSSVSFSESSGCGALSRRRNTLVKVAPPRLPKESTAICLPECLLVRYQAPGHFAYRRARPAEPVLSVSQPCVADEIPPPRIGESFARWYQRRSAVQAICHFLSFCHRRHGGFRPSAFFVRISPELANFGDRITSFMADPRLSNKASPIRPVEIRVCAPVQMTARPPLGEAF